jgi:hypothetical protein
LRRAYDDADLVRAITAYRFFFPSVSAFMIYRGNIEAGMVANRVSAVVENAVGLRCFTPNSDTPYGGLMLDVSDGPMVIELPPGALMGTVNDLNQRWVMDMGLPGPDRGDGGKHLLLPPGYDSGVPDGYYTGTPTTYRVADMLCRGLAASRSSSAISSVGFSPRAAERRRSRRASSPSMLTTMRTLAFGFPRCVSTKRGSIVARSVSKSPGCGSRSVQGVGVISGQ